MSNDNPSVIKGIGIEKTFKDFWGRPKVKALKGIDIDVKQGSIFALLGPNGAGKSTLMKLILGHLYPTAGQLAIFGKDPRDIATKERMGYLPERSYLYKNLTAHETLLYFGKLLNLKRDEIESRSKQLLEMVGLDHATNRKVGGYSHGMTRRMGLAQALLNDPDLLILDEPTAGMDPVGCREVKDLIINLGKRGKTVILTSHLLADVEDVCDDMMMIFGGSIQARGQINDLLSDRTALNMSFPKVSPQLINEVQKVLSREIAPHDILISSPTQSLESYFLNLVEESHASDQETCGARMGTGVADYLLAEGHQTHKQAQQNIRENTASETIKNNDHIQTDESSSSEKIKETSLHEPVDQKPEQPEKSQAISEERPQKKENVAPTPKIAQTEKTTQQPEAKQTPSQEVPQRVKEPETRSSKINTSDDLLGSKAASKPTSLQQVQSKSDEPTALSIDQKLLDDLTL